MAMIVCTETGFGLKQQEKNYSPQNQLTIKIKIGT
jgi:hypothetical protein